MKNSHDPRHLKRVTVVQELFAWDFSKENQPEIEQAPLKSKLAQEILISLEAVDTEIKQSASEWPLEQINKIDLAILRLAVFELIIKKEQPLKVVVDEAVELAKTFGSEASAGFINGVLGKIIERGKLI